MNKYERITKRTKESLYNAFWQFYKTTDIEKIKVKEICELANYDRTTFYRYFTDTTDILNQIENEIIDSIKTKIKNNSSVEEITVEKFKIFSETYGEYIVTFYEKGNRHFYIKFKELINKYVYDYLNINVQDEEKKEFLYNFMFSSLISTYTYWYRNPKIMDLESFVILINKMILDGSKIIINYIK
ncbi:MAG: TetR/AcrR family transcriptional regulator [Bacilli bacterium]|nr:TetR/AcrR family transcriptional regulator [Bacilli bacterium]